MANPQKRKSTPFMAGSRVLLTGDHPWAGHTAELIAFEELKALHKFAWRVQLDAGHECYADSANMRTAA